LFFFGLPLPFPLPLPLFPLFPLFPSLVAGDGAVGCSVADGSGADGSAVELGDGAGDDPGVGSVVETGATVAESDGFGVCTICFSPPDVVRATATTMATSAATAAEAIAMIRRRAVPGALGASSEPETDAGTGSGSGSESVAYAAIGTVGASIGVA
jgi:hypothetical protein